MTLVGLGACAGPDLVPETTARIAAEQASESESVAAEPPDPAPVDAAAATVAWTTIGRSVDGRPIEAAAFGDGAITVLVLASIHGDEAAATPLCVELAERLAGAPAWGAERRVVVVPTVNPDGVVRGSRHNAHAVDLNRNFPASSWRAGGHRGPKALSEPEARAVAELVQTYDPDRVLSFHQPVNLIDYDGPADDLAAALAAVSPLPVRRLGARAGSLGSWCGVDLGIPTVTVELPRSADGRTADELWDLYGDLLITAITYR